MENISQETLDAFKKENDMTIEEAISHVQQWIKEDNGEQAEAGIAELKKFVPELQEVKDLEKELRLKKSEAVQEKSEEKEKVTEATSNLEDVTKSEKFLASLGYFGFLCVLPLALKQDSEFCKYHGKQGLMLAILFFFMSAIAVIIPGGFGMTSLIHIVISVYGFMQARKGKLWNMPVFGDMARNLDV